MEQRPTCINESDELVLMPMLCQAAIVDERLSSVGGVPEILQQLILHQAPLHKVTDDGQQGSLAVVVHYVEKAHTKLLMILYPFSDVLVLILDADAESQVLLNWKLCIAPAAGHPERNTLDCCKGLELYLHWQTPVLEELVALENDYYREHSKDDSLAQQAQ